MREAICHHVGMVVSVIVSNVATFENVTLFHNPHDKGVMFSVQGEETQQMAVEGDYLALSVTHYMGRLLAPASTVVVMGGVGIDVYKHNEMQTKVGPGDRNILVTYCRLSIYTVWNSSPEYFLACSIVTTVNLHVIIKEDPTVYSHNRLYVKQERKS